MNNQELKRYILVKYKALDDKEQDRYSIIKKQYLLQSYPNTFIYNNHLISSYPEGFEIINNGEVVAMGNYICDLFQEGFLISFEEENEFGTLLLNKEYLDKIKTYKQDWQRSYIDECLRTIDFINKDNITYCVWVKDGLYE